jgi:GNAT superfamily N-acetyltransferase
MSPGIVILILVLAVVGSTFALIVRGVASGKAAEAETRRLRLSRHSKGPIAGLKIRSLTEADRPEWERYWASYCDFYSADVPAATTATTWARIIEDDVIKGYGAFDESDNLLGFAHVVLHPHTWSPKTLCYLEDLFVAQPYRGRDVGHALLTFLWRLAETQGWGRLYWHTEATNAAARRLYDRFRPADNYVRYTLTTGLPSLTEESKLL